MIEVEISIIKTYVVEIEGDPQHVGDCMAAEKKVSELTCSEIEAQGKTKTVQVGRAEIQRPQEPAHQPTIKQTQDGWLVEGYAVTREAIYGAMKDWDALRQALGPARWVVTNRMREAGVTLDSLNNDPADWLDRMSV